MRLPFCERAPSIRGGRWEREGAVAYVGKDDSVRAVDVEGLGFRVSRRTGGRVAGCRGKVS